MRVSYREELIKIIKPYCPTRGIDRDRIGNLIEGTRQEEGRQLTKNLGVSVEETQSIGSGLCPVLRCEERIKYISLISTVCNNSAYI